MNSNVTVLDLKPSAAWQSSVEPARAFAAVGERQRSRIQRPWHQRAGIFTAALLLQVLLAVALIRGGYVKVPKLPEALTVVIVPHEDLVIKAPPPTMPEIRVPITPEVPITIEVQSETAITLPPPRPQNSAPAATTGGGTSAALSYQAAVLRQIDAAKRYPAIARAQQRQGVVIVQFTMDRTGHVLGASLAKSSKVDILDREGVEAVKRASPFPAPPAEITGDPVNLMVAVEFTLH